MTSCVHFLCGPAVPKLAACCTISPASNSPNPYLEQTGNIASELWAAVCYSPARCSLISSHTWTGGFLRGQINVLQEQVLMAPTWGGNKSLMKTMLSKVAGCDACCCLKEWFKTMYHLIDRNQASLFILYNPNLCWGHNVPPLSRLVTLWPYLSLSPPLYCCCLTVSLRLSSALIFPLHPLFSTEQRCYLVLFSSLHSPAFSSIRLLQKSQSS